MAGRVPLSRVMIRAGYGAAEEVAVAVLGMPPSGLDHCGHGAPQDQDPHPPLVLGRISDQYRDARHLRLAAAAPTRTPALRDRVDDAPQVAARNGGPRAVSADRSGRGRRDLRRWPRCRPTQWP